MTVAATFPLCSCYDVNGDDHTRLVIKVDDHIVFDCCMFSVWLMMGSQPTITGDGPRSFPWLFHIPRPPQGWLDRLKDD